MLIHRDLEQLPVFKNAVITIGTFDGVHRGHQQIIGQVKEEAQKCGGESVIITFDPHPRQVLLPHDQGMRLLNTLEEKIYLLNKQHIDHLVIVPFTKEFSSLSATEYVHDFLVEKIHPHVIIIGYDHHFGHNREGNIDLLRSFESQFGFRVVEIPAQVAHDLTVSSTKIRKNLMAGQTGLANELLGYPYFISGKVVPGDQRGRKLGFPTANIEPGNRFKLIPAEGIYAAKVIIPSPVTGFESNFIEYNGAANIGHAPTFREKDQRIEVFIFDFDENIYDQNILLKFIDFIRPDQKFENAEALVSQMKKDVEEIKKRISKIFLKD